MQGLKVATENNLSLTYHLATVFRCRKSPCELVFFQDCLDQIRTGGLTSEYLANGLVYMCGGQRRLAEKMIFLSPFGPPIPNVPRLIPNVSPYAKCITNLLQMYPQRSLMYHLVPSKCVSNVAHVLRIVPDVSQLIANV